MAVTDQAHKGGELLSGENEKKKIKRKTRDVITAYFFMVPALLTLLIFIFGPILFSFMMSLYKNPDNDQLRNTWLYYSDLSNLSLSSLWRFFVLNNQANFENGVLMVNGIKLIIIAVLIIVFIRKFYKYHTKKPTVKTEKAVLFAIILSIPLTIIAMGVILAINSALLLVSLIIGGITLIASTVLLTRTLKKKTSFKPKLIGFVAVLFGLVIAPTIIAIVIWLFQGGLVIFQWLAVVIKLPIEEYRFVLTDEVQLDFLRVLFNTVFWTLVCVVLHITLGMLLAILMNRDFVGKGFFRGIFVLPWAIPSFVSTLVFRNFIFDNRQGFLGTRTGDIFYSTPYTYTYIGNDTLVHYGWEFVLGDIFALLFGIAFIIIALILIQKLLGKILKKGSIAKPLLTFLLVIALIPVAYILFNWISAGFRGQGWFSASIVKLPDITSTFWITDDVYFFGLENQQLKMVTFSAIILNTWLGVPFMMVSFLAALQNIPTELYEAADIGGSNEWQKFKKITFPLIKPTLFTVSLLGFVWTFNLFNVVYLLTENQTGLGDSKYYAIFVTYIYRLFDVDRFYSKAAAMSFIVFLILITVSRVYNKVVDIGKMFVGDDSLSMSAEEIKLLTLRSEEIVKPPYQKGEDQMKSERGANND